MDKKETLKRYKETVESHLQPQVLSLHLPKV